MSLINDMLRDLEERRAERSEPLQQIEIQPAVTPEQSRFKTLLKSSFRILLLIATLAVGYLGWQQYYPLYSPLIQAWFEDQPEPPSQSVTPPPGPAESAVASADVLTLNDVNWQSWQSEPGGQLTLTLNREPELALLGQSQQSLSFLIQDLKLASPLPLLDSKLLQRFGFTLEPQGTRFDLVASTPVGFNIGVDALRYQILIEVAAVEVEPPSPEAELQQGLEIEDTNPNDLVEQQPQPLPAAPESDIEQPGAEQAPVSDDRVAEVDYQALSVERSKRQDAVKTKPSETPVSNATRQAAPEVVAKAGQSVAAEAPAAADTDGIFASDANSEVKLSPARKPLKRPTDSGLVGDDKHLVKRATRLLERGKQQEAEQLLRSGIQADKAQVKSRALWAKVLLASGRRQEAEQVLQQGLELAPDDSGLRKLKARILLQQGQPELALAALQGSAPPLKSDPEFYEMRAAIYQSLADSESAAAQYYQLLQFDSSEARWWVGMGHSLEQLGQNKQAMQAYQNSLQAQNIDTNLRHYVTQRMQRLVDFQE